ncbi:MAG: hypothetical protein IPK99_17200 [Flavobacteriales bacterium]|nr:hypothetical protein [Flavobacteriales bacterium]
MTDPYCGTALVGDPNAHTYVGFRQLMAMHRSTLNGYQASRCQKFGG